MEKSASLAERFFWTLPQFRILSDPSKKRVIFMSDFGTGKTSLLKAKAQMLLDQNQKIVIISFENKVSSQESILAVQLKTEFPSKVHSLKGSGNNCLVIFLHVFSYEFGHFTKCFSFMSKFGKNWARSKWFPINPYDCFRLDLRVNIFPSKFKCLI